MNDEDTEGVTRMAKEGNPDVPLTASSVSDPPRWLKTLPRYTPARTWWPELKLQASDTGEFVLWADVLAACPRPAEGPPCLFQRPYRLTSCPETYPGDELQWCGRCLLAKYNPDLLPGRIDAEGYGHGV